MHRFFLCIILGLSLGACGIIEQDPTAKWDADRLYQEAQEEMSLANWARARELLEKIESRYPFGRHAQQAQLEIAYTYYKEDETAQAVVAADRFLKVNPNHVHADYALYLKGLSLFNYQPGVLTKVFRLEPSRRDPESMREAFDVYKELVERWPNSTYAKDARQRMTFLVDALAQHEVNIARYYLERGAFVAAINRAQNTVRDYQTTPAVQEALIILVKAYRQLGLNELAEDNERVLRRNFPQASMK